MNNLSILRRVVAVIFATGSIATTAPAAQFIETAGQVVVGAELYTSKTDGINHAYTFVPAGSPMQIVVVTSNGAPWLYESMITARQAITIPNLSTH
jgi:pyridoxal biosynthesis lyase PdxS